MLDEFDIPNVEDAVVANADKDTAESWERIKGLCEEALKYSNSKPCSHYGSCTGQLSEGCFKREVRSCYQ